MYVSIPHSWKAGDWLRRVGQKASGATANRLMRLTQHNNTTDTTTRQQPVFLSGVEQKHNGVAERGPAKKTIIVALCRLRNQSCITSPSPQRNQPRACIADATAGRVHAADTPIYPVRTHPAIRLSASSSITANGLVLSPAPTVVLHRRRRIRERMHAHASPCVLPTRFRLSLRR